MIALIVAVVAIAGVVGLVMTRDDGATKTVNTNQNRIESDGTVVKPDGTMIKPDGTMIAPDGTMTKPDGTMVKPDGTMIKPDGTMVGPDGNVIDVNTNATTNPNASVSNTNASTSSAGPAKYTTYSSAALASAQAVPNGDTVLYFHADWCPICRVLDPDITAKLTTLPAGLTILKVNYDQESALKKKYGVTYQHTFVQVDTSGNKLKLWSGSTNAADLASEVI